MSHNQTFFLVVVFCILQMNIIKAQIGTGSPETPKMGMVYDLNNGIERNSCAKNEVYSESLNKCTPRGPLHLTFG